jgi:hypothetical protein
MWVWHGSNSKVRERSDFLPWHRDRTCRFEYNGIAGRGLIAEWPGEVALDEDVPHKQHIFVKRA